MNQNAIKLSYLGIDIRNFSCLDYEEIDSNIQNFTIYEDRLDKHKEFPAFKSIIIQVSALGM